MSTHFVSASTATARKEHQCEECSRTITAGEQYQRLAGNWEGSFWSMKSCAHCNELRTIIANIDPGFMESMYGGLHVWVGETGMSPGELYYYHSNANMLSLHRWSKWFQGRWRDSAGVLRELPTAEQAAA